MKRWLIILTLMAVFSPNFAAASTRSSDIPLWKRLLAILTPSQTSRTLAPAAHLSRRVPHEHAKPPAAPKEPPDPGPAVGQPEGTPAPAAVVAAEGVNSSAPAAVT